MDEIITLPKWEKYCKDLCAKDDTYILLDILSFNKSNIHKLNFSKYSQKTIILLNPDIDFPPPKTPYLNDYELDMQYKDRINYEIINLIEKYQIKIICYSSSVFHPNVQMVPLGITWQVPLSYTNIDLNNKNIICYANFGLPRVDCWHGRIRQNIKDIISSIDFITIDNICKDELNRKTENKYVSYFESISRSKFALCPRGCGIDCYRFYDCLYYDCIPIIVKNEEFYKNLTMFPILVLETWEDLKLLTGAYLDNIYIELLKSKTTYKKYLNINSYYKL